MQSNIKYFKIQNSLFYTLLIIHTISTNSWCKAIINTNIYILNLVIDYLIYNH